MSYSNAELRETHIIGQRTQEKVISPHICPAMSFYRMTLAGMSQALPPFRFARTQPIMSQLLMCVGGHGRVWLDKQWMPCRAGDVYVTPARVAHAYYASDEDEPWQLCWINYVEPLNERPVIDIERPAMFHVEPQELVLALEGLYQECMGAADTTIMQQWTQLVQSYARQMLGNTYHRSDWRLQRLWKEVDRDLAHAWNSEELAARLGVSSEHLRRLCQQQYGSSPMKYVTTMRMQRAMALLASDSYSVESVALRVGYENPYAFSTAFKRYVGVAPSVYRQNKQL